MRAISFMFYFYMRIEDRWEFGKQKWKKELNHKVVYFKVTFSLAKIFSISKQMEKYEETPLTKKTLNLLELN